MRKILTLIAVLFSFSYQLSGQTRTIYGRVVDDDLLPLPYVHIQNTAKLTLGVTDSIGRFKIEIPQNMQKLLFNWIGYERAAIKIADSCDRLEVVMLPRATYDFMSSRQIDKDRLRIFRTLPELHLQAYKRGFFTKDTPCYTREFEPDKPILDSISKVLAKIQIGIKLKFERLAIGDTVKIPFSDGYGRPATDSARLAYYSVFADRENYGCVIKGVILEKNKRKKRYNLVFRAIDCDSCKFPGIYQGRRMKTGEVFTYNMRIFKILD